MWYLAEILIAERPRDDLNVYQCEACNVIFRAGAATEAYAKAVKWGHQYAAAPPANLQLLGVSHLTTIGEHLVQLKRITGQDK